MSRFIENTEGSLVNLDHVKRILEHRKEKGTYGLYEADGEPLGDVHSHQLDALTGVVVPAAPGATVFVMYAWHHDETKKYEAFAEEHPVIAWRITCSPSAGTIVKPIMPTEPDLTGDEFIVIPMPEGKFAVRGWDVIRNSLDEVKEWVIEMKRQEDNRRRSSG